MMVLVVSLVPGFSLVCCWGSVLSSGCSRYARRMLAVLDFVWLVFRVAIVPFSEHVPDVVFVLFLWVCCA